MEEVVSVVPWTRRLCLIPDELKMDECMTLLGQIKNNCPGTDFLGQVGFPVDQYDCSSTCSMSLVSAMSQCQTSLAAVASDWSDMERSAFRGLVKEDPAGPCFFTFSKLVGQRLVQIESSQCGPLFDRCAARADGWCNYDLRKGVGASLTPEGRANLERNICSRASPEYQALYECIANSGFQTGDGWSRESCSGVNGEEGGATFMAIFGYIVAIGAGAGIGYCYSKRKFMRGDRSGSYKPVSEIEVRSLIREYVDTSGLSDKTESNGLYSKAESDRP